MIRLQILRITPYFFRWETGGARCQLHLPKSAALSCSAVAALSGCGTLLRNLAGALHATSSSDVLLSSSLGDAAVRHSGAEHRQAFRHGAENSSGQRSSPEQGLALRAGRLGVR